MCLICFCQVHLADERIPFLAFAGYQCSGKMNVKGIWMIFHVQRLEFQIIVLENLAYILS